MERTRELANGGEQVSEKAGGKAEWMGQLWLNRLVAGTSGDFNNALSQSLMLTMARN